MIFHTLPQHSACSISPCCDDHFDQFNFIDEAKFADCKYVSDVPDVAGMEDCVDLRGEVYTSLVPARDGANDAEVIFNNSSESIQ